MEHIQEARKYLIKNIAKQVKLNLIAVEFDSKAA